MPRRRGRAGKPTCDARVTVVQIDDGKGRCHRYETHSDTDSTDSLENVEKYTPSSGSAVSDDAFLQKWGEAPAKPRKGRGNREPVLTIEPPPEPRRGRGNREPMLMIEPPPEPRRGREHREAMLMIEPPPQLKFEPEGRRFHEVDSAAPGAAGAFLLRAPGYGPVPDMRDVPGTVAAIGDTLNTLIQREAELRRFVQSQTRIYGTWFKDTNDRIQRMKRGEQVDAGIQSNFVAVHTDLAALQTTQANMQRAQASFGNSMREFDRTVEQQQEANRLQEEINRNILRRLTEFEKGIFGRASRAAL